MKFKHIITALLSGAVLLSFQSCKDDLLYDANGENYEGPVSLTLDFNFEPMDDIVVSTRDIPGNLDFKINNITLFVYDSETDETTGTPFYHETFNDPATIAEKRSASDCETTTYHSILYLSEKLASGSYRIYAIANVSENDVTKQTNKTFGELSEKELRELKIAWLAYTGGNAEETTDPGKYNIPDAMYGYFTVEDGSHAEGGITDVIYHQNASADETNRAPVVSLNRKDMTIQGWLKRVVSKLTVDFDGSGLNAGVEISIKSLKVFNVPTSSYLGQDNSIETATGVNDGATSNETEDPRIYIDYSGSNVKITRDDSYPATESSDDANRGALYFMENLQGTLGENHSKEKLSQEEFDELIRNKTYTYVEVEAYYQDTHAGKETKGDVTYRYMLGNDKATDCNVERNRHYKLTLSFIGDANNAYWNIEYDEEPITTWFRIPYVNETGFDDTKDNQSDWASNENWDESWVWYAYDENHKPIAEIAREMVFSHSKNGGYGAAYQVVSVYPIKNGFTDLKNGIVVQVLKCENEANGKYYTKKGGIPISMYYRYEQNLFTEGRVSSNLRPTSATKALIECDIAQYAAGTDNDSYKVNNGKYLYIQYDKNTDKLSVLEEPGEGEKLDTRPYLVEDKDKNIYSVVKIGASYWLQQNMRAEHMYSADEILNGNKSAAGVAISGGTDLSYNKDYNDYDELGDENNRYKDKEGSYNLAEGRAGNLEVYLPATQAAYKEYKSNQSTKYGLLYNFTTIAGKSEKPVAYLDGLDTRTYKRHGRIIQLEDNMREMGSSTAQITSTGYNDWQITPPGWHVPTSETSNVYDDDIDLDRNEAFGAYCDDIQYLLYYMHNNLIYAIADDDNLNWPTDITGKDTKQNLSGLSFYPITNSTNPVMYRGSYDYPYNEYSQYYYTSATGNDPWSYNDLEERVNQLYLPFWSVGLVYSASYYGTVPAYNSPMETETYHTSGHVAWLPLFYQYNGQLRMGPGYTTGYAGSPGAPFMSVLYPWCKLLTEQYLPVRACRNNFEGSYKAQDFDTLNALWEPKN